MAKTPNPRGLQVETAGKIGKMRKICRVELGVFTKLCGLGSLFGFYGELWLNGQRVDIEGQQVIRSARTHQRVCCYGVYDAGSGVPLF